MGKFKFPVDRDTVKALDDLIYERMNYIGLLFGEEMAPIVGSCESPIEQRMVGALMLMEPVATNNPQYPFTLQKVEPHGASFKDMDLKAVAPQTVKIYPQCTVLGYRADFLICARFEAGVTCVVIECDGHKFHERTKEQAAYDRKRDRAMTAHSFRVFRFTGSEIWRDLAKCVGEVRDFLKNVRDSECVS